jgi:hypothetical protein
MDETPVDELVVEYLERMHSAGEVLCDELCRRRPDVAAELRARLAVLSRVGLAWSDDDEAADAEVVERVRRGLFFRWLAHESGDPKSR